MNGELKEKLSNFLISLQDIIMYPRDCDYAFANTLQGEWDLIFGSNIIDCVDDLNRFYDTVEDYINLTQGENDGSNNCH